MNKSARTAAAILRARRAAHKAHRRGQHTLNSHLLRAGVPADVVYGGLGGAVTSKARQLRNAGEALGAPTILYRRAECGTVLVKGARRYRATDVVRIMAAYSPRKAEYRAAKTAVLALVAA